MTEIRLKIYRSPTEFRTETYRQPRVTIGREINNDIVIPEKDISRFHCQFECEEDEWRIVDLDSTNGSYLNGISIKKAPIKSGDVVVVGSTRLHVLECPAGREGTPAAVGGFELLQKFDARGVLASSGVLRGRRSAARIENLKKVDTRPSKGLRIPQPLAPVLTASEILGTAGDPTELLRIFGGRLLSLTEAEVFQAVVLDPETEESKWAVTEPAESKLAVPEPLLDFMRKKRTAIHVQLPDAVSRGQGPRAAMCAPILDGKRFLGAAALLRSDSTWKFGDADLETLAVGALGLASALGLMHHYARLERAYFDLLEADESLPAAVGRMQEGDAEGILLDASLQKLRGWVEELRKTLDVLPEQIQRGESTEDALVGAQNLVRQAEERAGRLSRISRQGREARGETRPVELLETMIPVLRDLAGRNTTVNERVASELPTVAVSPRVLRAALVRIFLFCRDRMHAVRLTLTAETCGSESARPAEYGGEVPPGEYVWISVEAEGDTGAIEELEGLRTDNLMLAHNPRSRAMGLYWASRMLRRAAAHVVIRDENERAIGFDLYLPILPRR